MNRWMMTTVLAGVVMVGGCGKKGPPSMPPSEQRVAEIVPPDDLGADQRASEYLNLLVLTNRVISGFNRFATNVDGLGDAASAELKQALADFEPKVRDLRTKVEAAKTSGALAPLQSQADKLLEEINKTGELMVP